MCVIIVREPGISIPEDKLELACDINKHGFGISWVHKGRLKTEYSLDAPNDPKEVIKLLKQLNKYRVYLHLRHATVGEVTSDNSHPFKLLRKEQDGMDLVLFHNGTLYDWSPKDPNLKDKSDTWNFVHAYAQPLARKMMSGVGGFNKLLTDDTFKYSIAREAGYSSKFLLADNFGNYTILGNQKDWKDFDGWRASNDYSFQASHHRSSHKPAASTAPGAAIWSNQTYGYGGMGSAYGSTDDDWSDNIPFNKEADKKSSGPLPWKAEAVGHEPIGSLEDFEKVADKTPEWSLKADEQLQDELACVSSILWRTSVNDRSVNVQFRDLGVKRRAFTDEVTIMNLDVIGECTPEQIAEMNDNFPRAMAQCIIDFIIERRELLDKLAKLEPKGV